MGLSYSTKPNGIAYKKGANAISAIREDDSRHKKSPVAGPGSEDDRNGLVLGKLRTFQAGYSLPPFTLATFAATTLTRFFITLLELKPSEQAIILDLFLKHLHGPLKVPVNDLDLQATKLSQAYLSFLSIEGFVEKARKPRCYFMLLCNAL
jgi:hypothetical protein